MQKFAKTPDQAFGEIGAILAIEETRLEVLDGGASLHDAGPNGASVNLAKECFLKLNVFANCEVTYSHVGHMYYSLSMRVGRLAPTTDLVERLPWMPWSEVMLFAR